ncbi:hypothetical protein FTZ_1009 [Francisella tularensis subsp. tularensis MA00-2987]|nr:hypothetical protein FTZ_1009 [Francisella tularensis subsp. tularensis MA00-2987]AWH56847.1 hypothetical protein FTV_1720 [Francisella tularensis subsp. tularensis TI0902]
MLSLSWCCVDNIGVCHVFFMVFESLQTLAALIFISFIFYSLFLISLVCRDYAGIGYIQCLCRVLSQIYSYCYIISHHNN